jgi:hypothetical protein
MGHTWLIYKFAKDNTNERILGQLSEARPSNTRSAISAMRRFGASGGE